jgi:transketolase
MSAATIRMGAYVLADIDNPEVILLATGSEVCIVVEAQKALIAQGIRARVVSMPCSNIFDRQSKVYQEQVLPIRLPVVAVEAAHPDFWRKYVGRQGRVVGISSFGESAPAPQLYEHFGITVQAVVNASKEIV